MTFVLLFIALGNAYAQKRKDSLAYVYKYPVKEGYIRPFNPEPGRIADPSGIECIYSKENEVFALTEGKIVRVFKLDSTEEEHLIIKVSDTAVVYGNLVTSYKKVGDTVHRGELLGKIGKDTGSDRFLLYLSIMVGYKVKISWELVEFIKRYH